MSIPFVLMLVFSTGCQASNLSDLQPAGPVTHSIDELFWLALSLMMLVLIPVFALTIWVVVKFRASRYQTGAAPEWREPAWLEWLIWLFPAFIVACLAYYTWIYTHRLDPYQPLRGAAEPIEIQVVALNWKWLFIYPGQQIATVNQVAFPAGQPVSFRITSATVMNSFFIPRLAGQIYAMPGMETRLHVLADQTGRFFGENSQYSGQGFPFQNFEAIAFSEGDFKQWIDRVKRSAVALDMNRYRQLAKPQVLRQTSYYASVTPGLFDRIIAQFAGGSPQNISARSP